MMNGTIPIPAPEDAAPVCRNCSGRAGWPYWQDGVCLRCAGLRLFGPASGVTGLPEGSRDACGVADGVPVRIGPYEIIEEIGEGGMGRVHAAQHVSLGRIVALKVMAEGRRSTDLELRFLREARTAAGLRHPNIVAVHDFGKSDGRVYFAMDYVEGGDLAARLRGRPFTSREAVRLLVPVARALAFAHGEGVLHRDLKPSNILLDGDEPRLADFGLAAPIEAGGDLTQGTGILGTPHYMAPEILKGGSAASTVASDLYALGTVLFEMLTGRTPFAGATVASLAVLLESGEVPSPRLLSPAVPVDLETICLKCLERDPARRYADAAALGDDLQRFLDGEPIRARPLSAPERGLRWARRRPALALAAVLAVLLAVGSTAAAVVIQRMLVRARVAEADSRERLREARLAEAAAVRRTTEPGRRDRALAALAEAARIRPGPDVRTEMLNTLLVPDVRSVEVRSFHAEGPTVLTVDPVRRHLVSQRGGSGLEASGGASLLDWEQARPPVLLSDGNPPIVGHSRFSPDGRWVALRLGNDRLRVWRSGEAPAVFTLEGRPNPGGASRLLFANADFDFAPDEPRLVVGLSGGGASLHRLDDGAETARTTAGEVFHRIRFSPDGRRIAACSVELNRTRRIWILDGATLEVRNRIEVPSDPTSFAWAPDSDTLAVGLRDNSIEIRSATTGRLWNTFNSPSRTAAELWYVGDGRLIGVRGNGTTLHLVDATTGREELAIPNLGLSEVVVAPSDGSFVTASLDGRVGRWETVAPTGRRFFPFSAPGGREQSFGNPCLDFSPDGTLEASSHGRYTLLREVASGRVLDELDNRPPGDIDLSSVCFVDDGRNLLRCSALTGLSLIPVERGADGGVRLGRPRKLASDPGFAVTDHTRDGRRFVMVSAQVGEVRILERVADGMKEVGRWSSPAAFSAAFDPAGERVVVNGEDPTAVGVRVHHVPDGAVLATLPATACGEALWSRDGSVVMTTNGQEESLVWDTASWKVRLRITGRAAGNITTFQLAPDGSHAVVVRDGRVHLLGLRDGSVFAEFDLPDSSGMASGIRFLPDGRRFGVLWQDSHLDLVDPEALRRTLSAHGLAEGWPVPDVR